MPEILLTIILLSSSWFQVDHCIYQGYELNRKRHLIPSLVEVPSGKGENCAVIFDQVDDYLSGLPEGDVELNLDEAIMYLEAKSWNSSFAEPLKLLNQLKRLSYGVECDHFGYLILRGMNEATRNRTRLSYHVTNSGAASSNRRLDAILSEITHNHVQFCPFEYVREFREIYQRMDKEDISLIEALTSGYINRQIGRHELDIEQQEWKNCSRNELNKVLNKMNQHQVKFYLNINHLSSVIDLRDSLKCLAHIKRGKDLDKERAKSRASMVEGGEKDVKLFNEYILKPCRYYTQELGSDVFIPAMYDYGFTEAEFEDTESVLMNFDYYFARAGYQLCSLVASEQENIIKTLSNTKS